MSWTDERVEILTKLWAEGLSASQIAGRLGGVTRNAVIGKVHRLGLSGRATTSRAKPARARKHKTARQSNSPRLGLFSNSNTALRSISTPQDAPKEEPFRSQFVELEIPEEERVDLVDLKECQCRWPIGDPQDGNFHFCGKKKAEGSPYCEYHSAIAFQPLSRQSAKAKTQTVAANKAKLAANK
ncbi:MAG: GcrA cell cycle regulator [Rhizobiales bacterium]|nr:GcrA cell cycle regulator [Hyphomicrobiales bacterium]